MRAASAALLVWAGLVGCVEQGPPAGEAAGEPALAPDQGMELTMQASLAPGEEATWCQYVLPAQGTTGGRWVQRVGHGSASSYTHHVIWYEMAETPASVAGQMEPFRCDGGIHLRKTGILYAPPAASGELEWPAGVAAHLAPDAVTLIEWHVINYEATRVDAELRLALEPPEQPAVLRAATLLFYDWFVYLPPEATTTTRMRCRVPADVTLMWASQHMHARGVGFTARVLDHHGQPVRELLQTDRGDADPVWYPGGIALRAGQWVEFTCSYDNPDDHPVIEGDGANDEMCMFVGGYFPEMDVPFAETCELGDGSGPVFHGSATCAQSLACLQASTDRVAAHACWDGTRAEDSAPLVDLAWRCASARCRDSCDRTGITAGCLECLQAQCDEELAACLADPSASPT